MYEVRVSETVLPRSYRNRETGEVSNWFEQECVINIPGRLAGLLFTVRHDAAVDAYDPKKSYWIDPMSFSVEKGNLAVKYVKLVEAQQNIATKAA